MSSKPTVQHIYLYGFTAIGYFLLF